MIAVLPFKKFTVNTEQCSQKLTADWKCINIIRLKKTQILASYCNLGQLASVGLHSGSHHLKPICDDGCLEIPYFRRLESLVQLSDHKSLTLNFTIRVFLGKFILLFKINDYFSTVSFTSVMLK